MDSQEMHRHQPAEESEPEVAEFQLRHRSLSDRVERLLMRLVILGLVALVLVQTLAVLPRVRQFSSRIDALEGIPYGEFQTWSAPSSLPTASPAAAVNRQTPDPSVTIVLTTRPSAPEVKLLVDGKPAGTFSGGSLTVKVKPGQVITVDARATAEVLTFRVVGAPGLTAPPLGLSITTTGNIKSLGKVKAN